MDCFVLISIVDQYKKFHFLFGFCLDDDSRSSVAENLNYSIMTRLSWINSLCSGLDLIELDFLREKSF